MGGRAKKGLLLQRIAASLFKLLSTECPLSWVNRGVGGTVANESALISAGVLLSRVQAPPPVPWPDGSISGPSTVLFASITNDVQYGRDISSQLCLDVPELHVQAFDKAYHFQRRLVSMGRVGNAQPDWLGPD
ncbi:hypothetical protein PoB_001887800 [Plakobranchus ocellatus]|uniref:Uncharacterized protein n=1 Tax=Plakobranchus ocellatus TaxID=259542 RepID=A0AAV3ZCA8_9GAST|nr:hypothetical protein PoB_001887800 [Plakobranchus ocellatus]